VPPVSDSLQDRPRIAVAANATLAAVSEPTRIVLLELPAAAPSGEIGVDPDAEGFDFLWVGAPPRLLVLSRYAAHSIVHLLDPQGPRMIAQLRLDAPMQLAAAVGSHALALGSLGPIVLAVGDTYLVPYPFLTRTKPTVAGVAESRFLVALPAAIEEWDPQERAPKRRLRLPRPAVITALGGSHRVVWMVTEEDARRIDVVPLVNRGQPKVHELPEPIAAVSSHPRSDVIVCIGATTGRLYAVDLDGRMRMRAIALSGLDRVEAACLVVGRGTSVLVAQSQRPIISVSLDEREPERPASTSSALRAAPVTDVHPDEPKKSTLFDDTDQLEDIASPLVAPPPAAARGPQSLAGRLSQRRERLEQQQPIEAVPAVAAAQPRSISERLKRPQHPPLTPATPVTSAQLVAPLAQVRSVQLADVPASEPVRSWRDEVVDWVRTTASRTAERAAPAAPSAPPIEALAERFGLAQLAPAFVLLYGAHLCGERGAAPAEVARLLGGAWDEALGRGQLAARGVAVFAKSRVELAASIVRALDELPAVTGTLVGAPGTIALLGPCVVVAGAEPLGVIAERCVPNVGGAILAAHAGADLGEVLLEARARGAVAMWRLDGDVDRVPAEPVVLVVTDEASAEELGIPRLP
jgi:hypothetical protein